MTGRDFWKEFAIPCLLLVLFVAALLGVYKLSGGFVAKTPTLEITSGNEIVTDRTEIPVSGKVTNTDVVTVNGEQIAVADDGTFNTNVPVGLGMTTIEVVAGEKSKTVSTNVQVTREEVEVATSSTSTGVVTDGLSSTPLATSGPIDNFLGSFGLAAIVMSMVVYGRSLRQNTLQKA